MPKHQELKLGLDLIDEPLKAAARSLLENVKQAKRADAFFAWQEHASLEASISTLQEAVRPYEAILNSLPQDRSKEDTQRICGLLKQMSAYRAFPSHVLEFIATHCRLLVIWEDVELPRKGEEPSSLYSVISGHVQCVMADPRDPLINYTVNETAQQILKEDAAAAAEAEANCNLGSPKGKAGKSPRLPTKARSPFAMEPTSNATKESPPVPPESMQPELCPYINNADTIAAYNLPLRCQAQTVASKLWRRVLGRIQAGQLPLRTEIEQTRASLSRVGSRPRIKRRSSSNYRIERLPSSRRRSSGGDGIDGVAKARAPAAGLKAGDGGGKAGQDGAAGQGSGPMGGPSNPWPVVCAVSFGRGDSFSGRELDCFHEVGLMEGGSQLDIPPCALAALPAPNSVAALLTVSRPIYRRALDMVQEHTIRLAVTRCCRLPFLRHTPLKELYKLARHLSEVRLTKGDTLIEQGKEGHNLYLLIEGDVEVVVDVPYTDDRELLESSLAAKMQDTNGADGRSSGVASMRSSRITPVKAATYFGPMQRVVMARRGPGSILGDDSLREKKMVVGVVVSSNTALALCVSQQRFAMSVDPLTLRLFYKLKTQQGALPLMSQAVSAALLSKQKIEHCREVVLAQSYEAQTLPRTLIRTSEGSLTNAAQAVLTQSTHFSPPGATQHKPRLGWCKTSHFKMPNVLSLAAGDHADHLLALHKKNQEAFELEMRLQTLAKRSVRGQAEDAGVPNSPPKGEAKEASKREEAGMLSAAAAAASKSLMRSTRTMRASFLGAQQADSELLASRRGRHRSKAWAVTQEDALEAFMPQSMRTGWMKNIPITESVAQLQQMIKQAADKRKAEVLEQEHRNLQGHSNLLKVDASIVHKLDISLREASGSSHRHTEMLESACIAVIKVHMLPGQAVAPCDALAPVLDDVVVGWSAFAHSYRLQLVRWSSFEYALLGRIDPSESRRLSVKVISDCLLQMKEHFNHTIQTNAVPHYAFCAGLAVGGAFAQYQGGRFLAGVVGTAVTAAELLADAAVATQNLQGCIFISDVAMQAVCRTHIFRFSGPAYELQGWVSLPCNSTFDDVFGPGSLEREPMSQGMASPLTGFKSSTQLDLREEHSAVSVQPAYNNYGGLDASCGTRHTTRQAPHAQGPMVYLPELEPQDNEQQLSPSAFPESGPVQWPGWGNSATHSPAACSPRADVPGAAQVAPGQSSQVPKDAWLLGVQRSPGSPSTLSPQGSSRSQSPIPTSRSRPRWGPASLTTLEPDKQHLRVAQMRTKAELASSMDVRQRLRKELHTSRVQAQLNGGIPVIPSTGMMWGGLQGGLKSWGWDGRARTPLAPVLQVSHRSPLSQQQQQQQTSAPGSAHPLHGSVSSGKVADTKQGPSAQQLAHRDPALQNPGQQDEPLHHTHQQQKHQHCHHHHPQELQQQQQGKPRTSSPLSPCSDMPEVFGFYAPGRSPLSSLSARQRACEVLFSGAALAASAHQLIRPISPARAGAASGASHSPKGSPRSGSPPVHALASSTQTLDALGSALEAAIKQLRTSPERRLPERPDSAKQVLHRPLSAHQRASMAAVAVQGRPRSAGSGIPDSGPLSLASPSLRLQSNQPPASSAKPATPPNQTERQDGTKLVPTNHGFIPISLLQGAKPEPAGAQPQQGAMPAAPRGRAHPGISPAPSLLSSPVLSPHGGVPGSGGGSSRGWGAGEDRQGGSPEAPCVPGQSAADLKAMGPSSPGLRAAGSSRGCTARPRLMPHTPASTRSRHVDPYTGMSLTAIHEQAVATWKDLGSVYSAQEYVEQLPQGQVNLSFSTAALTTLPDLSRLQFLESLAASFNNFHLCPDPETILGTRPLTHLSVLCMSHCGLTQLPTNIGLLLPSLMELNIACNSITEIPPSLYLCHKLKAISLERNKLSCLPPGITQLSCLEALYVGGNRLQALPDSLPGLQRLLVLDTSWNNLKELPATLPACTQLVALSAAHNRLTRLPPAFLDTLTHLRWLELQGNSLRSCPQINGSEVSLAVMAYDAAQVRATEALLTASADVRVQQSTPLSGTAAPGSAGGKEEQEGGGHLHLQRAKGRGLLSSLGPKRQASPTAPQQGLDSSMACPGSDPAAAPAAAAAAASPVASVQDVVAEELSEQEQLPSASTPSPGPTASRPQRGGGVRIQHELSSSAAQSSPSRPLSLLIQQAAGGMPRSSSLKTLAGCEGPAEQPKLSILDNELAQEDLAESTPARLPNLQWLNCASNSLAVPPFWLPSCLTGLDLSRNRLAIVPAWLVEGLPQLQLLALHGNCIASVCDEITSLQSLKVVSLEENPATDPGNLEEGGCWVSDYVCASKFDHKRHLEAALQQAKNAEQADFSSEAGQYSART